MRKLAIAAAFGSVLALLGACSVEATSGHTENPAGGYDMQIAATDDVQTFLVTAPNGKRAAGRVDHGVSSVIDANEARLAMGEARAAAADLGPPPQDHHIKINFLGFQMEVNADDDETNPDGRAQIAINAGGRQVHINADDSEEDGRALVHVAGASESDVRGFIEDQDDLSDETKASMLAALGLTETAH